MTNQISLTFSALAVLLIVGCSSGVEPKSLSFTFEELRSTAFIDSLLALKEYRTPEGSELVFGLKYGMTTSEVYDRSKELEANTGGEVFQWDVDNHMGYGAASFQSELLASSRDLHIGQILWTMLGSHIRRPIIYPIVLKTEDWLRFPSSSRVMKG